ncbi:MAG TPA: phage virion morphogenesis protein [Allosphingosinicella sp.]|jgi:phage gpG-like protein
MSDLAELEQLAGALLRQIDGAERRKVMRAIVRDIAKSQGARIARQQAPDGGAYEKRKAKPAPPPGGYAVRFLYPKGAPEPRVVFMKSWVREGPLLTGFDTEAGGIRSFFWDKVDKWLPIEAGDQNKSAGKFRRKGSIRRAAMFRRLRNGRFLRSGVTDREAWVGFSGRVAQIARIHQDGGRDRPSQGTREVRYARRQLIGLTDADRARILDSLLDHISG